MRRPHRGFARATALRAPTGGCNGFNPLKSCVYYAEADAPPFTIVDRSRIMFDDSPSGLVTLADELKALFNQDRGKPRLVLLLSPT